MRLLIKNKIYYIIMTIMLIAGSVIATGCSSNQNNKDNKKFSIVCTTFPQYDWTVNILGDEIDKYEVTLLLQNGTDMHSYQPTAEDIMKISSCDMFIYIGGESDKWVEDALNEAKNKSIRKVNLLDKLGIAAKEEETVNGVNKKDKEEAEKEYDEHIWLSLKNAEILCDSICREICEMDPECMDNYIDNEEKYVIELGELEKEYETEVFKTEMNTLVFGDRFPFRYLMDSLQLKYYAAFPGCSAETEAGFETIIFLSEKVDELGLKNVLVSETSDKKIAETIIENTTRKNQKILTLNSMQSVTKEDIENGQTYLSIMKDNLEVLKEALK